MVMQFLVIDGADEGRVFPLNEGTQTLGNSRKNSDICLHDLLMSRVHCQVEVQDGKVVVTDIEHSTGTLVNGQKIKQHTLAPGDVVRVGNSYLRLQIVEEGPPNGTQNGGSKHHHHGHQDTSRLPRLNLDQYDELVDCDLGHYLLESILGRGFTSVVFRAHDRKKEQTVALKVLHPHFPRTDAEMHQFARILKPVLPLRHANVIGYLGAGKFGPFCWIAMEYVDGEGLAAVLQRMLPDRKIDWHRGFRMMLHVARALTFLHSHHLKHTNLTPKNILVNTVDHQTRVTDFAHGAALGGSEAMMGVLEGKVLAELPYMAPEQTQGDAFVDELSDIYSLGVIAYQMLTGKLPFEGGDVEETISLIQQSAPIKPRKHQKGIPEPLERIILRMLAKHQEERPQRASELVAELERFAEEHEVGEEQ